MKCRPGAAEPYLESWKRGERGGVTLTFTQVCVHFVSPRDLWSCVLPRWQFHVKVNVHVHTRGREVSGEIAKAPKKNHPHSGFRIGGCQGMIG